MSVEKICEDVKGHFTIVDAEKSIIGYLYYELYYSHGVLDVNSHRARLRLPGTCVNAPDEERSKGAIHYFKNGTYTHSELDGEAFFDQIKMPTGMSLCRRPDGKEYRKAIEKVGPYTQEARKIEEQHDASWERFQPLRVIIDNFQLPDKIKMSLQGAEEQIIKTIIDKYL